VVVRQGGELNRFMLVNGSKLQMENESIVTASSPISVVGKHTHEGMRLSVKCPKDTHMQLGLATRPQEIELGGRILDHSRWRYKAEGRLLTVLLAEGQHALSVYVRPAIKVRREAKLTVKIAGEPIQIRAGVGRSVNDTQVAWGEFTCPAGFHRVRISRVDGAAVWLGRNRLTHQGEAALQTRNMIVVESPLGSALPAISFVPLYTAGQGIPALLLPESDPRLKSGRKTEAESYAEGLRGKPRIYSHRTFLSGGKGVSTLSTMGIGARWRIEIDDPGDYRMVWKVATHEPYAERAILIDGKPVTPRRPVVRFNDTTGFGATPAEWRHYVVSDNDGQPVSIRLERGPHSIDVVSVTGLLNIDYLVLARP